MRLDDPHLLAALLVFVRCIAVLVVAPIFGQGVPPQIRLGLAGAVALALAPQVAPMVGPALPEVSRFAALVAREALMGALIGACIQLLMHTAQMAGAFVDLQMGLSNMSIFSPLTGGASSLVARFKFMLALVLFLLMDGHHLMFQAIAASYDPVIWAKPPTAESLAPQVLRLVSTFSLLALQIAAPPAAVCVVVDMAAATVNKAVPQMQVFLVSMPAKIFAGVMTLALALPLTAAAIHAGVEHTFDALAKMLGGG